MNSAQQLWLEQVGSVLETLNIPQADGARLPVAVTSRQVLGSDGQAFGIVTATDISALKQTEARLREANAQLEQRYHEIEEELVLAASAQQSLAPSSLTWGRASVETFHQPARTIGGDFGLIAPRQDGLTLLVCDVSGHGISSALVANRIYTEAISQMETGVGVVRQIVVLCAEGISSNLAEAFRFGIAG